MEVLPWRARISRLAHLSRRRRASSWIMRDEWKGMNDLILPPVTPSMAVA
jgi:hypothetical protein